MYGCLFSALSRKMPVVLPRAAANNVRCVGSSGDLPPPSPPAEKATTSDGTGYSRRGYRNPDRTTEGLAQSVENLAVEQLIAKAGVEALDVAVLPGAAPLDVGGLGTDSRDPFLHRLGDELRPVVGADVSGNAP